MSCCTRIIFVAILMGSTVFQAAAQAQCLGGTSATPQVEAGPEYTFVRFRLDERGHRQYCDTVAAVTSAAGPPSNVGAGPLFVVFVHGWKHDGTPSDSYVDSFRMFLGELAAAERSKTAQWKRRVVGVYVSWPANDGAWASWAQNLNFWETKKRADVVQSRGEVRKLLGSLNDRLGYFNPRPTAQDGMMVTIGHSFGARIVFESIRGPLETNVIREGSAKPGQACTGNVVCNPVSGFGELVVLLNPAFEADLYNIFYRFGGGSWPAFNPPNGGLKPLESWPQMQPPLLLALGAINDDATAKYWPVAHPGADRTTSTTLTNYDRYVTHELLFDPDKQANVSALVGAEILDRTHTLGPVSGASLVPRAPSNNSPFVVARADHRLMDGHGGIWGSALRNFLVEYLDQLQYVKRLKVP